MEYGKRALAISLLRSQRNYHAQLIRHTLQLLETGTLSIEEVKYEAGRLACSFVAELDSDVRILEVVASLAPLLGLFGTVLGMIDAFQTMEAAGARVNPSVLSGGIWKASGRHCSQPRPA